VQNALGKAGAGLHRRPAIAGQARRLGSNLHRGDICFVAGQIRFYDLVQRICFREVAGLKRPNYQL
jgi:hypothetical protein